MENLWGMIEKVFPARFTGRDPESETRWDVMFVSENGRVSRITDFKRHVRIVLVALLTAFTTTLCFLILFAYEKRTVTALKESLAAAQATISALVDENDELVARLVAVQEKDGQTSLRSEGSPEKVPEGDNANTGNTSSPVNVVESDNRPSVSASIIAVEDVSAKMVAGSNQIEIRFAVRKIDQQQQYVSGRAFVFLDNAKDPGLRQIIPPVSIVDGRPTQISRGQFFSIARYKPMTMVTRTEYDPEDFQKATILVFTPEGELMYKQMFSITVRVVAPPPPEPVANRTTINRATETETQNTAVKTGPDSAPQEAGNEASVVDENVIIAPDNSAQASSSEDTSLKNVTEQ